MTNSMLVTSYLLEQCYLLYSRGPCLGRQSVHVAVRSTDQYVTVSKAAAPAKLFLEHTINRDPMHDFERSACLRTHAKASDEIYYDRVRWKAACRLSAQSFFVYY